MGSICEESVGEYAGHLRSMADFGGSHRGYVSHLATLERHDSTIRATTSAVALGVELGLLPPNDASMPQRTAKAAKKFALPAWRPYGDERHLEAMARATGGIGEGGELRLAVIGAAVISRYCLLRVGEMSAIHPSDLSRQAIYFRRFKTGTKSFRVQPPPIFARWAEWLAD